MFLHYVGTQSKRLRYDLGNYILHCQPTGKELGRGTWSTVVELELMDKKQLATRLAGKVFKFTEMKGDRLRKLVRDIEMVVTLQHNNIIDYKGVYFLPDVMFPVLVMEQLMSSLYAYLTNKPFSVALDKKYSILFDVASGLDYLHSHTPAIIHQNLTPKNVLLRSKDLRAKISDCCDARILAVEAHKDDTENDHTTDINSFGLLALFTITETEVHLSKSQSKVSFRLGSEREDIDELVSEAAHVLPTSSLLLDVIKWCVNPAGTRQTAAELKEKLLQIQRIPLGYKPCNFSMLHALLLFSSSTVGPSPFLKKYTKKATPTGQVLGVGSFGRVIEMKLSDQKTVAGKIFKITSSIPHEKEKFDGELYTLMQLNHANVVECMGVTLLPDELLPVLLMEKLEGNLSDYILGSKGTTEIPLEKKALILLDTARGLEYLHSRKPPIVHRDLTAKNVLLDSQQRAKIGDFGNSRIIEICPTATPKTLTSTPGTLEYMPPEALGRDVKYGPSLDVFSFGHLLLFIIIQKPVQSLLAPTYTDSTKKVHARSEVARRHPFVGEAEKQLSENHALIELMKQCLHNLPEQRPCTGELVTNLMPPGKYFSNLHLQ